MDDGYVNDYTDIDNDLFNCILVNEDIRPAYYSDNYIPIDNFIYLFPNLHVNYIDLFKYGKNQIVITKHKLSNTMIKSLTYNKTTHDTSIGKLLGYPCYKDFKHRPHTKNHYGIHLMVKYKHKNKIKDIQVFGNICSSKEHMLLFETYAKKSNDIIHKYIDLLNKLEIKIIKFYVNHEFSFGIHVNGLLILLLINSNVIKGYPFYSNSTYISLAKQYFPYLHKSKQTLEINQSINVIFVSKEKYKPNSINPLQYMFFYDESSSHKYIGNLVCNIYNDIKDEIIDLYVYFFTETKSKTKFKEILDNANLIKNNHTIMKDYNFKIKNFDILFKKNPNYKS